MGWTKRQFITQAYGEVGLADYVFDLSPEDLQDALRKLDAMMATWNGLGIRIGYPLPGSPSSSDIDAATGTPDMANEAIYTSLAVRIAPGLGKMISPDVKLAAKNSYNLLLSRAAAPLAKQFPAHFPAGAGNKPWNNETPFLPSPVDPLLAGPDGEIEFD